MSEKGGTGWMYNPNGEMNKEEYLLGKKIGRDFESQGTMGQINAVEFDCAPPSIFASQAVHQVDLQRKLAEDPLVMIKKQELEVRKKILDNPLKMRALQEHIDALKKAKKDKKKKKKKKKKKDDSDDDTDQDLDLKLLQRLQRIEERDKEKADAEELEEERKRRQDSPSERYKKDARECSPDTPPRNRKYRQGPPRGKDDRQNHRQDLKRDREQSSPTHHRHNRRSRSRSGGRSRRRSPSPGERRKRSPRDDRRYRRQSRSRSRDRKPRSSSRERNSSRRDDDSKKSSKDEERERKLREMMANADWREEQRANKVKAYRKQQEKEEEEYRKEHDEGFMSRHLKTAAANSTVESRIKSNKYNIQRDHGVMDKNFARR